MQAGLHDAFTYLALRRLRLEKKVLELDRRQVRRRASIVLLCSHSRTRARSRPFALVAMAKVLKPTPAPPISAGSAARLRVALPAGCLIEENFVQFLITAGGLA